MHHGKQLHVPSFAGDQQAAASGSSSPARRPAYMTVYGDVFCSPDNLKARILAHPLFEQLLAAHVACLRIAAPVDHYHTIDSTSVDFLHIASKYFATSGSHRGDMGASPRDKEELHQFMVSYIRLLELFKQKLQEQFSKQACDAISACREIEQAFYNLTGVSAGPGNGSMMPGDGQDSDSNNYLINYSSSEPLRIDPVLPYDINKSLVDHVRRELKNELKKDYEPKLKDVHEEIRRKRRAGKLPEDKTHVLKEWWTTHACWPYPTEEEKARLVEESGLQLKQINNWFINQRKRNWQAEASNQHMFTSDEASMDRSSLVNISLSLNNDMQESSNKQCP